MRAYCYLRVSSREQIDGYSLAAQERALRDYCQAHGWGAPVLFADQGVSAYTDVTEDRPQFAAMLAAAEAGECDVILVHKLDRFARSLTTTLRELRRLEKSGCGFVSLSEDMNFSSPIGRVILATLAAFAEYFSENLSKESKKGLAERMAQGYLTQNRPYGALVSADGKAWTVDPARAADLTVLLDLAATQSYAATAQALNAAGITPRRATLWRDVQVRSVVRRSGWLADQPDPWPARYHAAITRHDSPPVRAGRQIRALTGLMRCGHCGGTVGYLPRPTGPPGLQCHQANGVNRCGGPRKRSADHYERAALAWVAALPLTEVATRAREINDAADEHADARAALRDEAERLGIAFADGALPHARYRARLADVQARQAALPAPLIYTDRWLDTVARLCVALPWLDPEDQSPALRTLIARVVITGHECRIEPHPELAPLLD